MEKNTMPETYTSADVQEFLRESEEWCGKICKVYIYDENGGHVRAIKEMKLENGKVFLTFSQLEEEFE